jgi:hypothetical protein
MKEQRFTFRDADGRYPAGRDGRFQWAADKVTAAMAGKNWAATKVTEVLTMERCAGDKWFIAEVTPIEEVMKTQTL